MRILRSSQGDHDVAYLQIQPDHFIELDSASASNLPQPSDPGFDLQYPATVPCLIGSQLIWNCRTRANERHISLQNIDQLGQLIQAGSCARILPIRVILLIIRKLIDTLAISVSGRVYARSRPQLIWSHILCEHLIIVGVHRTKFQECKVSTILPDPLLSKQHRTFG